MRSPTVVCVAVARFPKARKDNKTKTYIRRCVSEGCIQRIIGRGTLTFWLMMSAPLQLSEEKPWTANIGDVWLYVESSQSHAIATKYSNSQPQAHSRYQYIEISVGREARAESLQNQQK